MYRDSLPREDNLATVTTQMTEQDYARAAALRRRAWIWWTLLAAGLVIALPASFIAYAVWAAGRDPFETGRTAVIGWAMAWMGFFELSGWSARRAWRKVGAPREPIVSSWTPEGLELRVSTAVERYRWRDLREWREDAHSLIIRTHDKTTLLFPKRQIEPGALDELRGYLSAGVSPTPPAELPAPLEPPGDGHRVRVGEDDFAEAYVLQNHRRVWNGVAALGAVAAFLGLAIALQLAGGITPPWPFLIVFPALVVGLVWFARAALRGLPRQGRRLYAEMRNDGKPFDLGWSEGGIDIAGPLGWEHVGWDTVKSWRETPGVIIVTSRQNGWLAFPKRTLTEAQLADLRAKLGGARTRKAR